VYVIDDVDITLLSFVKQLSFAAFTLTLMELTYCAIFPNVFAVDVANVPVADTNAFNVINVVFAVVFVSVTFPFTSLISNYISVRSAFSRNDMSAAISSNYKFNVLISVAIVPVSISSLYVSAIVALVIPSISSMVSALFNAVVFIADTLVFIYITADCVAFATRCISVNSFVSAPLVLYFVCGTDVPLLSATACVMLCNDL
jgi:hypothetical protein